MEEQREHAILFAATLLCARKLIETMESDKPNMAKQYFVESKSIADHGESWSQDCRSQVVAKEIRGNGGVDIRSRISDSRRLAVNRDWGSGGAYEENPRPTLKKRAWGTGKKSPMRSTERGAESWEEKRGA